MDDDYSDIYKSGTKSSNGSGGLYKKAASSGYDFDLSPPAQQAKSSKSQTTTSSKMNFDLDDDDDVRPAARTKSAAREPPHVVKSTVTTKSTGAGDSKDTGKTSALDKAKSFLSKYSNKKPTATTASLDLSSSDELDMSKDDNKGKKATSKALKDDSFEKFMADDSDDEIGKVKPTTSAPAGKISSGQETSARSEQDLETSTEADSPPPTYFEATHEAPATRPTTSSLVNQTSSKTTPPETSSYSLPLREIPPPSTPAPAYTEEYSMDEDMEDETEPKEEREDVGEASKQSENHEEEPRFPDYQDSPLHEQEASESAGPPKYPSSEEEVYTREEDYSPAKAEAPAEVKPVPAVEVKPIATVPIEDNKTTSNVQFFVSSQPAVIVKPQEPLSAVPEPKREVVKEAPAVVSNVVNTRPLQPEVPRATVQAYQAPLPVSMGNAVVPQMEPVLSSNVAATTSSSIPTKSIGTTSDSSAPPLREIYVSSMVKEADESSATRVEKRSIGTQHSGNHAGTQVDIVPEGLLGVKEWTLNGTPIQGSFHPEGRYQGYIDNSSFQPIVFSSFLPYNPYSLPSHRGWNNIPRDNYMPMPYPPAHGGGMAYPPFQGDLGPSCMCPQHMGHSFGPHYPSMYPPFPPSHAPSSSSYRSAEHSSPGMPFENNNSETASRHDGVDDSSTPFTNQIPSSFPQNPRVSYPGSGAQTHAALVQQINMLQAQLNLQRAQSNPYIQRRPYSQAQSQGGAFKTMSLWEAIMKVDPSVTKEQAMELAKKYQMKEAGFSENGNSQADASSET